MKRITSACLEQTIRFDTYNDAKPEEDLKKFLELMDRKKTKYQLGRPLIRARYAKLILSLPWRRGKCSSLMVGHL